MSGKIGVKKCAKNSYVTISIKTMTKIRLIALLQKGTTYDRALNILMDEHIGGV